MVFTYLKVKSAKCLNLFTSGGLSLVILVLVLVLRIWSCLHHWFWSFGGFISGVSIDRLDDFFQVGLLNQI